MYKRLKHITLFLIFTCSLLTASTPDYERQTVGNIEVILGTDSNEIFNVQSRMKTREGDFFSQTSFDTDLKMLARDYDRIEPSVQSIDDQIYITIKVWPHSTIRNINWEGNRRIKTKKLQKELDVSCGSNFERQEFNAAFHNVKAYYVKKGFFEAELDYVIVPVEGSCQVDICISINEGRAGSIKNIHFENFTCEERNCILSMMVTKKYDLIFSIMDGRGVYNDEMILHDRFQIINYLQNKGYADANVDIKIVESCNDDRIVLCITADRGQRYYFDEITIKGNEIYSTEELMDRIPICKGDPYSPDAIHNSLRFLTNYYGSCGYIDTAVNYIPEAVDGECRYKVHIEIEEGEQYHVGLIKVIGNRCTQTKVILHETLLVPGEVFNLEKLQITEARLANIGYFDNVNVYAVKSEGECTLPGNYRDIMIEVEEASTGNIGASLGFSTVENLFGSINLTECNFNIKGLKCFSRTGLSGLRGGGEYAHLSISVGAKSLSYGLSWTKPYFNDTPWSVGFDLDRSIKEYISNNYDIRAVGLNLHATYECNAFMRVGTHYRIRYTDVHTDGDQTKESEDEAEASDGMISAIGYSWRYNTTNHPLCPTRGLKSRAEFEVVGLGGDSHFLSFAYLNSWYYNLWDKAIFKLRGDLRFIQPMHGQELDEVPLDERFFLGGDNTIRGYYSYRLGPKFDMPDKKDGGVTADNEDPKGGLSMQLFSMEICKPLFGCGDVFAFFDAGALSSKTWDFGYMYLSSGIGARIQVFGNGSPPLMVGYGWPINPKSSSEVKRFFITVGGKF